MLRNNKNYSSTMQKTYDECYLICSTAIYFEGQDNEEEALRSWRSALDRIYYHNAYKVAPNYQPASATEKALQDSLKEMELQCKERVTLLEALKKSREEADSGDDKTRPDAIRGPRQLPRTPSSPLADTERAHPGWIGGGTVPPVTYSDLPSPTQAAALRPNIERGESPDTRQTSRAMSAPRHDSSSSQLSAQPGSSGATRQTSRTPSPEKRTMLRTTLRPDKNGKKAGKSRETLRPKPPPVGLTAAGLAWTSTSRPASRSTQHTPSTEPAPRRSSAELVRQTRAPARPLSPPAPPKVQDYQRSQSYLNGTSAQNKSSIPPPQVQKAGYGAQQILLEQAMADASSPKHNPKTPSVPSSQSPITYIKPPADFLKYRGEYPTPAPVSQAAISASVNPPRMARPDIDDDLPPRNEFLPVRSKQAPPPPVSRRPVGRSPAPPRSKGPGSVPLAPSGVPSAEATSKRTAARRKHGTQPGAGVTTPPSSESENNSSSPEPSPESKDWRERLAYVEKHLPKGVDEAAAKSIFNEIVVKGDEVHWDDIAGLDIAKTALKEAVVYPFLRPDLFMGLREPARGMLLFGPPGTGKTMLARAVATESKSTFFAISASSLTSKWLGESEKLVRALFQLAKALAPSIIFVDEIDSLLGSRGDGEHETTRRIKTEFLIGWSDLQRAAAGKETKPGEGDASRVLVLAATNRPWAIDEAARRRFVRRQYIPLPEAHVREQQLRTLLGHQKHTLRKNDIKVLVEVTDGYSGSDITALAKDAAMGPLRSLGESLLHMTPDEIRPIMFNDFEASLVNIRPSVSKQGLKEFEDWANQFGERGG